MGETAPRHRRNLATLVAVVVAGLGIRFLLDSAEPLSPDAAGTAEAGVSDEERSPPREAVEIGTPTAEPGWTLHYEADLGSPMRVAFTELREVDGEGGERPYRGKLTLHYGDGISEAYPVVDDQVVVFPRPIFRQQMVDTRRLGVEFQGHEVVEHELKWILVGTR
jgi:hypothetical protein